VAFETTYTHLSGTLTAAGTALLRVPGDEEQRFLVCVAVKRKRLLLLGPDHAVRAISVEEVRAVIARPFEAAVEKDIERLLRSNESLRSDGSVRASLLTARLQHVRIEAGWLVRVPARGSLRQQIVDLKLRGVVARLLVTHVASQAAWICAWIAVGAEALQGRLDSGRLLGAGLILALFAVCAIGADRLHSTLALRLGVLLRRRLLEGALALDARSARSEGVGQFLGRIYEAQAVEALSVGGGLSAAIGAIEWIAALVVLMLAGGTWTLPGLLVSFAGMCAVLQRRCWSKRGQWTATRRGLTRHLIESMVGHRTHLAQSDAAIWRDEEDRRLRDYLQTSRSLDSTMWVSALLPRAWLVAAAVAFGWLFVAGAPAPRLAITIAGILLGFESLRHLALGLPQIAGAWMALDEVAPLLKAAGTKPAEGDPSLSAAGTYDCRSGATLVEAQQLVIRAAGTDRPLLNETSFSVHHGDRVLLEGPSGGGKSTLAALLAGLRKPDRGVLLLGGLDLATLGESAWRRRISLAAQFHENHIVSETLAFNLLMGRQWPATAADFTLAESICRELGLGDLLDRMPAGLDQVVGESGWQLSHGEKSRIYIARALLQDAELVILDESLAALDPENLNLTLRCVFQRARSVLVVAHP